MNKMKFFDPRSLLLNKWEIYSVSCECEISYVDQIIIKIQSTALNYFML